MAGALGMMARGGSTVGLRYYDEGGSVTEGRALASMGRHGDSILVHMSPEEFQMLQQQWGEPTVNPKTGLPEYFKLGSLFKSILPVAAAFIPGVGPAIGAALGLSGATAAIVGNAILGAGVGGITGGGKGALRGGALAGMASAAAPFINNAISGTALGDTLGLSPKDTILDSLGNSSNPLSTGASEWVNPDNVAPSMGGDAASSGGGGLGALVTGGADIPATPLPEGGADLLMGGGGEDLVPLQSGSIAFDENGDPMSWMPGGSGSNNAPNVASMAGSGGFGADIPTPDMKPSTPSFLEKYKTPLLVGGGMLALSGMGEKEQPQAGPPPSMSGPTYAPMPSIDFQREYVGPDTAAPYYTFGTVPFSFYKNNYLRTEDESKKFARGGMSMRGPISGKGDGRDDMIPANLSDGEYVMDAESVAMLGNGSNDAGAQKLDQLRKKIRQHKGKTLAKGKFSPDAKNPDAYMAGGR